MKTSWWRKAENFWNVAEIFGLSWRQIRFLSRVNLYFVRITWVHSSVWNAYNRRLQNRERVTKNQQEVQNCSTHCALLSIASSFSKRWSLRNKMNTEDSRTRGDVAGWKKEKHEMSPGLLLFLSSLSCYDSTMRNPITTYYTFVLGKKFQISNDWMVFDFQFFEFRMIE